MASTDWKESPPEGEDERFAKYAEDLRALQKKNAAGRALHAKATGGFRATFEVLADLPENARHGLFAKPATHEALVRFSNGAGKRQSDKAGDVRGMAVKVLGVDGKKALGDARTQDFLAILSSSTPFRTADEFVSLVLAAASPATLLFKLGFALGFGRTFRILKQLSAGIGAPVATLAGKTFFSALPIRLGPHAVRFAFAPRQATDAAVPTERSASYLADDLARRLSEGPLAWDMKVQFFQDEATTPIEDASVDWTTPYVTVARLVIPQQDATSAEGKALAEKIEKMSFDPWHALVEHTPLGGMMRARKHAYFASTQERGAAAEPG